MKNRVDIFREWRKEESEGKVRFTFPAPEGAGIRPLGFDYINDAAMDAMRWYGFRFGLVTGEPDVPVRVTAGFAGGRKLEAAFALAEPGAHSCGLALSDFDIERAKTNIWRELMWLEICPDGGNVKAACGTAADSAEAALIRGENAGTACGKEAESVEAALARRVNAETACRKEAESVEAILADRGNADEVSADGDCTEKVSAERRLIKVVSAELLQGSSIAVETDVLGKSGNSGETVRYTVTVHNCLGQCQWVRAVQAVEGWESMYATVTPERFLLQPYGSCQVEISVQVHDYMPAGAHEKTIVRFVPEGNSAGGQEVAFMTLRALEHPYIYHRKEKWAEVAENIRREEVFRPGFEKLCRDADSWEVPPMVPFGERDYCCDTFQEHYIMSCAYMYSITGDKRYAEKIAAFFRLFTDPETGYPVRKKGCSQSYVQEGHFFQHLALAYDMIYGAGVLSEEEHRRIGLCFRIYMEILDRHICCGHISNWTLSELTGAVYCAMALQDYERMERFLFGPCGSFEQLSHGAFSDGWWYECSVGYNIWVSSMFLHTAHALLPFGINLIHNHFPISYGKEVDSINKGETREIRHGMYNEKWGGIRKSYIRIKDLFDAVIPFLDERGVLFGINDSDEKKIEGVHFGSTFDLAYTYYRDPAYIPIIRSFDMVDPVFGHAYLPEEAGANTAAGANAAEAKVVTGHGNKAGKHVKEGRRFSNACSDNIGIAMLRSQTKGRAPGEQIQAVLRYGSHGYAHGHFDRTELLSVMRYGRSFFNPEHLWWGYGHFMYKFYVQNSNTKNMVVVDGKMQIPADARKILFYSGEKLQASGVRTVSRWGYPPFGGMIYREGESLEERCEYNASDLPSYDAAPYGEITEGTEPVVQTRVMAVLDDCIVIFDSLQGEREHRYESLMQIKGFRSLKSAGERGSVSPDCHTGKKSEDPRSDEQFITDCFWYEAEGETVASFTTKYGRGEDSRGCRSHYNVGGCLCMDVYTAWPLKTRQCLGLAAEDLGQKSPYSLKVWEDESCREKISANPWLLGARKIDVALCPDSHTLKLEVLLKPLYSEQMYPHDSGQCLFLGNAFLELEDGRKAPLHELPVKCTNIDGGMGIGKDYEGGRVLIEGEEYSDAIPVSTLDHSKAGVLEYDLAGIRAVGLTGIVGVDNFPGDESQRRRTYGVAQRAVYGRFITVIEPHEGTAKIASVEGLSENRVRVRYQDGRWQEITAEDMDGTPRVSLCAFAEGAYVYESTDRVR